MFLAGKLSSELEINIAAEIFYKIFKHQSSQVPNISPKFIQQVNIQEGDGNTHGYGSIKIWNYTVEGKAEVFKEKVEYDDKQMTTTLIGLDGDVFKHYKSFKAKYKAEPKGPVHCLVTCTVEYEKLCPDSIYPYKYLDLMNNITKDIESYVKK